MPNAPEQSTETADLPRLRRIDLRPARKKKHVAVSIRLDGRDVTGPSPTAVRSILPALALGQWDAASAYELAEGIKTALAEAPAERELVAVLPDVHDEGGIAPVPCVMSRELAARFADGLAVECTYALAGTARPGQTIWIDDGGTVQRIAVLHTTEDPEDDDDG